MFFEFADLKIQEGSHPVSRAGEVAASQSWFPFLEYFWFYSDSLHEMIR
jgi:hypothetical protein